MSITVNGGVVTVSNAATVKATVDNIVFVGNRVNGQVPLQATGVMVIKNVPDGRNFNSLEVLFYRDGNNNNNASLRVDAVVGPTKYNVTRVL